MDMENVITVLISVDRMESDVAVVEEIIDPGNVDELAEEAHPKSDTDSWTIIDEEECSVDANRDVATFKVTAKQQLNSEDGSDIETLATTETETGEDNLDSFVSDGLPVTETTEDIDSENPGWIWESEHVEKEEKCSEEPDLLSLNGELPLEFPSIEKGHTYSHVPNVRLNVLLTTALVLAVFLTAGLGIGHWKGWSEKLELQEQWSEEREERMVELTDTLVTCITSGQKGEGQLEDEVILQLNQENNDLKLALAKSRGCEDGYRSIEGNMLLRQRINELLIENADLEKEVARLRYSHSAIADAELTKQDLINTKKDLNDVANENDQLKMEVGKTRYGMKHKTNEEEEEKIETTETEEEKIDKSKQTETTETEETEEEKVDKTETKDRDKKEETERCKTILKTKFHKAIDRVKNSYKNIIAKAASGGLGLEISKLSNAFNTKMDEVLQSVPDKVAPAGKKLFKAANKVAQNLRRTLDKGVKKATEFMGKSLGEDPVEWKDRQMETLEETLAKIMDDWTGPTEEDANKDEEEAAYNVTSPEWLFARAKDREHQRQEERRSNWLFDRAKDREKFHKLTNSEWYEKKLHRKDCSKTDDNGNEECVDLEDRNPASRNHGVSAKKHWKKKKGDERYRKDEKYYKHKEKREEDEKKEEDDFKSFKRKDGKRNKYQNKKHDKKKSYYQKKHKDDRKYEKVEER